MFERQPQQVITVSEAVERFIHIFNPEPGDIVKIKRAYTDFSVEMYNKRDKHWLRSSHSLLEKLLRNKWRNEGRGF